MSGAKWPMKIGDCGGIELETNGLQRGFLGHVERISKFLIGFVGFVEILLISRVARRRFPFGLIILENAAVGTIMVSMAAVGAVPGRRGSG
jgi:hypothetical protein